MEEKGSETGVLTASVTLDFSSPSEEKSFLDGI